MVYTVDAVDTVDTAYTVYTIETALHCLNISMYAYILLGKVRTLLEVAELLSRTSDWTGLDWTGLDECIVDTPFKLLRLQEHLYCIEQHIRSKPTQERKLIFCGDS